jgi:hypothetical protein
VTQSLVSIYEIAIAVFSYVEYIKKPNPLTPFPYREGGTGVLPPSPRRGGVGGEVKPYCSKVKTAVSEISTYSGLIIKI